MFISKFYLILVIIICKMRLCAALSYSKIDVSNHLLNLSEQIITLHIVARLNEDALDNTADGTLDLGLHLHGREFEQSLSLFDLLSNFDITIDQDTRHWAADAALVGRIALLAANLDGTTRTSHEIRGEGVRGADEPLLSVNLEGHVASTKILVVVVDVGETDVEVLARSNGNEDLLTGLERSN